MGPDFRSDKSLLYITLSIILHAALFGAAAFLNNNRFAEDTGQIDDYNRSVLVTAVFRENKQSSAKDESILPVDEKINENTDSVTVTDAEILKSESPEKSKSITENPAASDNNCTLKNEKASELNPESGKSAVSSENSESKDPKTLTIDSFTTDLKPEYPKFAKKNNYEGIVRVSLTVNRIGRGENIQLLKSSGHSVLDKAALKAVKKAIFRAKSSHTYYLSAALKKPLVVDINFRLEDSRIKG